MDGMITTTEAAKILNVTSARVRQLISEKRIKSRKIGRDHFICVSDIQNFAANEQKKAGRPKKNKK